VNPYNELRMEPSWGGGKGSRKLKERERVPAHQSQVLSVTGLFMWLGEKKGPSGGTEKGKWGTG